MPESRTSSLSKFKKPNNHIELTSPLEPMTQLYLKEFFKNHALKINRKQHQAMFSNSIEVLNLLIEEYQEKFQIQNHSQQASFTLRQGKQFQTFYNRLKNLFESLYQKLENQPTNSNNQVKPTNFINIQNQSNYQDYLFPQNSMVQNQKISSKPPLPQTDEQLYQLVTQLKRQNQQDLSKIKNLEKKLRENQKNLHSLQQKLNHSNIKTQNQQQQIQHLTQSFANISQLKTQYEQKCIHLNEKLTQFKHNVQKTQVMLLLKDEQIKRLQTFEKAFNEMSEQKIRAKDKLKEMNEKYQVVIQQQLVQKEKTSETQKLVKQLKQQNKKLKKIITTKLSLISSSSNQQNVNKYANQGKSNNQNHEYLKDLFTSVIKNEKLISTCVQKEIRNFIYNMVQKQKILIQNLPITQTNPPTKLQ